MVIDKTSVFDAPRLGRFGLLNLVTFDHIPPPVSGRWQENLKAVTEKRWAAEGVETERGGNEGLMEVFSAIVRRDGEY